MTDITHTSKESDILEFTELYYQKILNFIPCQPSHTESDELATVLHQFAVKIPQFWHELSPSISSKYDFSCLLEETDQMVQ